MTSPDPTLERVPLSELRDLVQLGAALPFRLLDAQERLLLGEGQVVATERQFEQLHERGAWAERARVEALRAAAAPVQAAPPTLFHRWERLVWDLDATLQRVMERSATPAEVTALVARTLALLDRDPDVALFMAMRQDDRRFALYALTHSLHSASVAVLAARQLGWESTRIASLAAAALTMNAAILRVQGQLAEQRDPPTLRQREAIEQHPLAGAQALRDIGVNDEEWLGAVEQHHEQPGGGGYPRKVATPAEAAQLLRLADMLMAKVTPRAYRPPQPPRLATRDVFLADPDKRLATAIVRVLGVYPPGSVVQIKSGETGVVTRRVSNGTGPEVRVLTAGAPGRSVDTALAEHAIVQGVPMPAGVARIYPEQVYGLILVDDA